MVAKVNPMAPRAFGIVPGEEVEPSSGEAETPVLN